MALGDCFEQLRSLKPPHYRRVLAIDGPGCMDNRIAPGEGGLFESHDAFHTFLGRLP